MDISHRLGDFALHVAFEAGPGVTALFGRSGSGKTSIVNAVAGLLRPDAGRVEVGGEVLFDAAAGIHVPPHRRRFGYVFQDARLFPHLDVAGNLRFGARLAPAPPRPGEEARVVEMLGIGALMARRTGTLSGGEKARVALGRALLSRPRMLLMDEPLAALDAARKDEILPYLERLRDEGGVPILYVSHAVGEVARLADTLILLSGGGVVRAGPAPEVLSDPEMVPILGVREAGAVIEARVIEQAADGLAVLDAGSGLLELPGVAAPVGAVVRLRVLAQDVILSRSRPEGLSAVNVLPARVVAIRAGGGPGAAVALSSGPNRLLARVTARSVRDLGLGPGVDCFAILQATTVARGSIGQR